VGAWIEAIVELVAMVGAVGAFEALIAGWTVPQIWHRWPTGALDQLRTLAAETLCIVFKQVLGTTFVDRLFRKGSSSLLCC